MSQTWGGEAFVQETMLHKCCRGSRCLTASLPWLIWWLMGSGLGTSKHVLSGALSLAGSPSWMKLEGKNEIRYMLIKLNKKVHVKVNVLCQLWFSCLNWLKIPAYPVLFASVLFYWPAALLHLALHLKTWLSRKFHSLQGVVMVKTFMTTEQTLPLDTSWYGSEVGTVLSNDCLRQLGMGVRIGITLLIPRGKFIYLAAHLPGTEE